jgi:hypothetical protein
MGESVIGSAVLLVHINLVALAYSFLLQLNLYQCRAKMNVTTLGRHVSGECENMSTLIASNSAGLCQLIFAGVGRGGALMGRQFLSRSGRIYLRAKGVSIGPQPARPKTNGMVHLATSS